MKYKFKPSKVFGHITFIATVLKAYLKDHPEEKQNVLSFFAWMIEYTKKRER